MNCHLSQVPVFALQYCCLNFCGHGLLAVVARFERLADAMAAEAKATAKAAAKPKAKAKTKVKKKTTKKKAAKKKSE